MTDMLDRAAFSGIEQLRAMIAHGNQPSIGRTLDFALIEVDEGRAVFEGNPDDRVYNPIGSVHGGYAATLLDSACGVAVHSRLAAGPSFTTLGPEGSYLRGLSD